MIPVEAIEMFESGNPCRLTAEFEITGEVIYHDILAMGCPRPPISQMESLLCVLLVFFGIIGWAWCMNQRDEEEAKGSK